MSPKLDVCFGGYSSAGQKPDNEDAFAAWQPSLSITRYKGVAACIADGVSCSRNAQQASTTSVTHFLQDYYSTPESWDVKTAVGKVLGSLNAWLYHHGQQAHARQDSLVTTFTGAVLKSNSLHLFHVGDSRLYRLRAQEFECLTRDHTHRHGRGREFLSRALGMDTRLEVDYQVNDLLAGDVLMFTSDGVHGFLADTDLAHTMTRVQQQQHAQAELEGIAEELVRRALDAGSDDNLTCFLMRIDAVPTLELAEAQRILTERGIPPALQTGQRIDHYRIDAVLHAGTRSHVYRATDLNDGRTRVLKAPSVNFREDLVYLEGFAREQWVGSRIDHAAIMKILPPEPGGRFLYHVCEHIEGITLRQWIHDHPQASLRDVRAIVQQLIHALRALQRGGMVHRDLKPENIMICDDGHVKLIDFGTVAVRGLAEIDSPINEDVPVGSVDYIAPEYVLDGVAVMQSDLFSLAIISYEMLAQALPYRMEHLQRRGAQSRTEWHYHPLREHRPDLPLWLDLTLEKACNPVLRLRYQAYSEFWSDLLKPNPELRRSLHQRLLKPRGSGRYWRRVSAILLAIIIVQACLLVTG